MEMNDMTNDYDKLHAMKACASALRWIGDRTIEQAWSDCKRSDWMCWLLKRIAPGDPRLRLAAADMAERVWNLITDEPMRLTAAWAIGAARRGNEDEMRTASATAYEAAATNAVYATYTAAFAASAFAASNAAATNAAAEAAADWSRVDAAADNAASAADNAAFTSAFDDSAYDDYAYATESAAQADILREYFSAREVSKLFKQTPIGGTP